MQFSKLVTAIACMACPVSALATNGMNMEAYGPIALGMGGASMAYDNGSAAMMNNPATLGLMAEGHRLDLALGMLAPDVNSSMGSSASKSSADAFGGPALGWSRRHDKVTLGVGVYGQGGMGTEYGPGSFMSMGTGLTARSELGVGRVLFPVAYNVSPNLVVGGSVDFVWAGLDLQMAMNANQLNALATQGNLIPGGQAANSQAFGTFMSGGQTSVGYFDFSNNNDFSGKAHSTGWAGKLGVTYKISKQWMIGATYHSKTDLGDMEADGARMSMIDLSNAYPAGTLTGKIKVVDFQWPETYGFGFSYQVSDRLMIAADYKRISWAKVMKNFHMVFTSADMGGLSLDMKLPQEWKDQDVWMMGFAYQATDALTLRAGVNIADNPVPDALMHPLFPAIVRNHYTAGLGYQISKASSIDFAYSHAPEVSVTNSSGITVSHGQNNMQFIYSYRY
ncbi:MAG: outer membrane protein transport protein [Sulfuricella denitrificans]|nr:outer membrane protein transport protein [Sulfuricella denitrificans]